MKAQAEDKSDTFVRLKDQIDPTKTHLKELVKCENK